MSRTAEPLLAFNIHFGQIIKVVVILGRIISLHNCLHISFSADFLNDDLTLLQSALDYLQGPIPHNPSENNVHSLYYVWFSVLLQTCQILLHHPLDQERQHSFHMASGTSIDAIGFKRCETASGTIFEITQQLLSQPSESLMNPFIVTSHYIGAYILSISLADKASSGGAESIEALIEGVDRIGSRYHGVSLKYRRAMMRNLLRDEKELKSRKLGSGDYLDAYCD